MIAESNVFHAPLLNSLVNPRCLSFCMDKLEDGVIQKDDGEEGIPVLEDLVDMVGYVLYIPTVISGPIVVYRYNRRYVA